MTTIVKTTDDLFAAMKSALAGEGSTKISLQRGAPPPPHPRDRPEPEPEPQLIHTDESRRLYALAADIRLAAHHADDRRSYRHDIGRAEHIEWQARAAMQRGRAEGKVTGRAA